MMEMRPCLTCDAWTNTPCSNGSCSSCHENHLCVQIDRASSATPSAPMQYREEAS